MEGIVWFGLGLLAGAYFWHQGFKSYINSKLSRSKKKDVVKTDESKDKDNSSRPTSV